jgi:hypothetical protein
MWKKKYPKGIKVSNAQLASVNLPTRSTATGTTRLRQGKKLHHAKNELTDLFMDKP